MAVGFSMATLLLLWYLALVITREKWRANAAALTYALLPYAVFFDKVALIEGPLSTLIVASLVLYFRVHRVEGEAAPGPSRRRALGYALSGSLMGLAVLTKYSAAFVAVPLLLSFVFTKRWRQGLYFLLGAVSVGLTFLAILLATGLLQTFLVETIQWQFIRFRMSLHEKLSIVISYIDWTYLIFIAIGLSTVLTRGTRRPPLLLLCLVAAVLMSLGGTLFVHYFLFLTPMLCVGLAQMLPPLPSRQYVRDLLSRLARWRGSLRGLTRATPLALAFVFVANFILVMFIANGAAWPGVRSPLDGDGNPWLMDQKGQVAEYIDLVTGPGDPIWTSEASLAFLANRQVVPANVSYWRFQGFFPDVWAYDLDGNYHGPIPGYPNGLVTLAQIREGWVRLPPMVIVIIRTSVTDYLVWAGMYNGATQQAGLGPYISSNYHLGWAFSAYGTLSHPTPTEVWVRN